MCKLTYGDTEGRGQNSCESSQDSSLIYLKVRNTISVKHFKHKTRPKLQHRKSSSSHTEDFIVYMQKSCSTIVVKQQTTIEI